METTTRSASGSYRRNMVWSHNTSYPGAAGVHSEISRKAHAIRVNGQKELSSSLSTIQSIHQKELRSLNHHRKSLETSMLAYSEKMRKISSERFHLASFHKVSNPVSTDEKNVEVRSVDRLMFSTTNVGSVAPDSSRVSVDSGVELSEIGGEVMKKTSSTRSLLAVPLLATDTTRKPRPVSFHSLDKIGSIKPTTTVLSDSEQNTKTSRPSKATRQRRTGTMEEPDVFALKLSMPRRDLKQSEPKPVDHLDSASSDDSVDPSLAIMPFPEPKPSSQVRVDESGILITPKEDKDRSQGASSRTSQSSTKKLMKNKENYWSYRKTSRKLSLAIPNSHLAAKNRTPSEGPTPSPRPQLVKKQRTTPRRSNKTYHKSFRYSDAVDGVIKSLDETPNNSISKKVIRRASEILPSLNLHDLRQERQRIKQETGKVLPESDDHATASIVTTTTTEDNEDDDHGETDNNVGGEDRSEDGNDNDDIDNGDKASSINDIVSDAYTTSDEDSETDEETLMALTVYRERSLSAPEVLHHHHRSAGGQQQEEADEISTLMAVAQGKSDSDCFNNVPPRKTVHFDLPPFHTRAEERQK